MTAAKVIGVLLGFAHMWKSRFGWKTAFSKVGISVGPDVKRPDFGIQV